MQPRFEFLGPVTLFLLSGRLNVFRFDVDAHLCDRKTVNFEYHPIFSWKKLYLNNISWGGFGLYGFFYAHTEACNIFVFRRF